MQIDITASGGSFENVGDSTPVVLRKKSVRDEFVDENLRETLDCTH